MRVTQGSNQAQFLSAIGTLESDIADTENQVSSGKSFTTPSQDPAAAGAVDNYQQLLSQSQQYTTNANSAQTSLSTESTALTQVTSQLQSLRDIALQANSGTVSAQNLAALATQAQQIQASLIGLANTQDGNGNYIFAGYATQTQPFSQSATGASYAGDSGQLQVQIAAGQTVATGDNGNTVFNQIPTGNGTFAVTVGTPSNGSGLIGATSVSNPTLYNGGDYSIQFTAPDAYKVVDSTNTQVSSGSYTSGQAIAFDGLQITLSGQPATGDSFDITPSKPQSLFTSVQNLVNTLQAGASGSQTTLSNAITVSVNNIDQALTQTSTAQASVGGRLNAITTQQSVATSQQAQLTQSISSLQSLDYAAAITSLDSQNTTLSAALQAFSLTQGLTLFKYIG